jgi:hypothetical protein
MKSLLNGKRYLEFKVSGGFVANLFNCMMIS